MCSSATFALKTSEKGPGHLQILVARLAALQEYLPWLQALVIQYEKIVSRNTFACELQPKRHCTLRLKPTEQGFTHETLRVGDEASQS